MKENFGNDNTGSSSMIYAEVGPIDDIEREEAEIELRNKKSKSPKSPQETSAQSDTKA